MNMPWQDQIPGCFGTVDGNFAVHPSDEKRAQDAIRSAKDAGATLNDFEKEMVWHIYKSHDFVAKEHMDEQITTARKMWR